MTKSGKPPIIQAWIEFQFDHPAERPEWGWQTASAFFDPFLEEYPEREVAASHHLQIAKVERNQKPQIVDERIHLERVRAFRADHRRQISTPRDFLHCP